jgi:hypothetical protein
MDDPMKDVVRSPLEELEPWPTERHRLVAIALLAAAAAAAVTLLAATRIEASPITTTTTTTTTVVAAEPGLPPGYADTGAGYGVRVEWMFSGADALHVALSTAVPSDGDRSTTRPVGATILGPGRRAVGAWTVLLADGRRVAHTAETVDEEAPGTMTVSFPVTGVVSGDVVSIEMVPATGHGMRVVETTIAMPSFPVTGLETTIPATELVEHTGSGTQRSGESRLLVEGLDAAWSHGWVRWTLEGEPGVLVRLEGVVGLAGSDEPVVLASAAPFEQRFLSRATPPLTPAASGVLHLRRSGRPGVAEYEVTALECTWTVTWARYEGEPVTVPTTGAVWLDL